MSTEAFKKHHTGYCHCCRSTTEFISNHTWLRDHYRCVTCNSIPRQRHLQYILDQFFPGWEGKIIHESSPSNDYIARHTKENYAFSQFFPEARTGDYVNNVRCENLESLTFADATIDIFITQDVLEHVFHPEIAAREVMRVLKNGGAHIFTAPKHKSLKSSYQRALLQNGEIIHLREEQYHGNPIGDGRALVTWDYGDDFEFLLHKWCQFPVVTYVTRDEFLGIEGEYLEVFVVRKF